MAIMKIEIEVVATGKVVNAYVGCYRTGGKLVGEICLNERLFKYFVLSVSEVNRIPLPEERPENEMVEAMNILNEVYAYLDNREGN